MKNNVEVRSTQREENYWTIAQQCGDEFVEASRKIFMFKLKLFGFRLKEFIIQRGPVWMWDYLAPKENSAIKFAHQHINDEPKRELTSYRKTLEWNIAHFGQEINIRIRENRPLEIDKELKEKIALNTADCDLVLYRGVDKDVFDTMQENAKSFSGGYLFEKAFLHCSLVKGHEKSAQFHLRIYVPKGTPLIYLGNVNFEILYYGVVVQRGALLKIISNDDKYYNCRLLQTD